MELAKHKQYGFLMLDIPLLVIMLMLFFLLSTIAFAFLSKLELDNIADAAAVCGAKQFILQPNSEIVKNSVENSIQLNTILGKELDQPLVQVTQQVLNGYNSVSVTIQPTEYKLYNSVLTKLMPPGLISNAVAIITNNGVALVS